jgi:5-oxoprolinase (ATP-hydrolysing)
MNSKQHGWKIWIDTGGTFTDCLAYAPDGELKRVKVLSSSALRGKILEVKPDNSLEVSVNWPVARDILKDYAFHLSDFPDEKLQVLSFDPATSLLRLRDFPDHLKLADRDFEITAGEEAPILAARIATQTALDEPLPVMEMRLGSTRGTNALLERRGASTALLLTRGFGDLLTIDTQQRPDIFALNIRKPLPYYQQLIEVDERLDAAGKVITPLREEEIARVLQLLQQSGVRSVAIALMHSYLNDEHEVILQEAFQKAGFRYVSCSAALAPSIKILPRAKTALVNAYLSPAVGDYLASVQQSLQEGSLKVMTSAGGLIGADLYQPKDSLLSGPAGGVVGAASICRLAGFSNPGIRQILAFDMGGTSTDVSRYDGEFDYRYETQVGEINLFSPSLAIETVAAGGGSCCYFDGHKLSVGPESAGASPGPACYGFGGPLTLTDVNLLLGRVSEKYFGIPISRQKAAAALQQLKQEMQQAQGKDYSDEEVLTGLLAIANEKMTGAIRKISLRKGYDPQEYALLAFGGAGGQHACRLAEILHIREVIVPYDAGLLSAYGMGQATIERFAQRQILQPLSLIGAQLEKIYLELRQEAFLALSQEGYAESQVQVRFAKLQLRFRGQESSLEIGYSQHQDIHQAFREKYTELYGHWLEDQEIEVATMLLAACTRQSDQVQNTRTPDRYTPPSAETQSCWVGEQWRDIPVFIWEELQPGATITGPSLVVSQNCTTVIDTGWAFVLDRYNNALISSHQQRVKQHVSEQPEAVQLELFTNRFGAIAEEMGALLERTSFSVNVKERLDFSCALLDSRGELVVNAPHIPVHLGSMGICVRTVAQYLPLEEGDVVITNHPGFGGSHLPDITLISPVFVENSLVGYVANRAHHAELGGKQPGSMPPDARNLQEEGVVIRPDYLIRKGKARWDHIRQLLTREPYPSRSPEENIADLNGALASIQFGVAALKRLCQAHTTDKVLYYMQKLKDYAHACMQQGLQGLPEGSYDASEYLDDGTPIQLQIRLSPERVKISFAGSGDVHPANLNATLAIVNSAVLYVLRLLIRQNIPLNEGLMQQVELEVPPGSFLNPSFPAEPASCPAVVGGNTETSQRVVDTLLKALGIAACSQGTMNNLLFGNERFGYYETIGGGSGAGEGFAGTDAVHQHMTNTRITDPEVLEFRYPVRLQRFAVRQDSGGEGKWRGGNGISRELLFLEEVSLTLLSQHRKEAPYGVAGGKPGACGTQYIVRHDGSHEAIAGICQTVMQAGDRIIIETPGGGGFGKA